jgi:galactitol-specific phosphotransferase system IIB component
MLLVSLSLSAQTSKKEFQKSYDSKELKEIVITNRYGQIEVEQTAGGPVEVDITMAVTARSSAKADEILSYISINDVGSGSFLNIEADYGKNMTLDQMFSGVNINVGCKLRIPAGLKLRLIHSEGNVFVDNFSGDLTVDLKTGNFQAGTLKAGEFYIKQDGGSLIISSVEQLNGELKSCDLKIEEAQEVKLHATGCTGTLASVDDLTITSQGGRLQLGQIERMSGTSQMTKYEIQDIGDELSMDLKMGEINVRNIHFNFSKVDLTASMTKVGLTFMQDAGYDIELRHNKNLKMDLPRGMKLKSEPAGEKNVELKTGFVGNSQYDGKVYLDIRSGNLFIQ